MFSAAGNVLGQRRLSMKPVNMECNLFLKYNLRAMNHSSNLAVPPEDFQPPNSQEMPSPVTSEHDDLEESSDIEVSSDEE
jgi:hypothetical protein